MRIFVGDFTVFIIFGSKPDVTFLIKPNGKWIPIGNQNPLSDVELKMREVEKKYLPFGTIFGSDYQWVLNIFLHNPWSVFIFEKI